MWWDRYSAISHEKPIICKFHHHIHMLFFFTIIFMEISFHFKSGLFFTPSNIRKFNFEFVIKSTHNSHLLINNMSSWINRQNYYYCTSRWFIYFDSFAWIFMHNIFVIKFLFILIFPHILLTFCSLFCQILKVFPFIHKKIEFLLTNYHMNDVITHVLASKIF